MLKQEKIPNRRKYNTISAGSTTETTSLRRATDILNCLGNDINTVTDIAAYLGYSTSTVHRLLQNMSKLEWATQDVNNHKYYLGPMVTQLASNQIAAHKYLIMHALREMTHLSTITQETISLAIMVQLRYVLLHEISSTYTLKITEESKILSPVYSGATSKALLAQLDDKELKATLKHVRFDRAADNPTIDKNILSAQLQEIRRQGYCVTSGERISGGLCISAPIKNYIYPATLNILGPEERLKPKVDQFIKELQASADRISEDIEGAFNNKGGDE
ncbi:MAG: IclR family transcriptional regulator [Dehalococcoidales bacterium]